MQDMEATIISGNGTETGQIIATTVGGRNGQPKQVICFPSLYICNFPFAFDRLSASGILV